MCLIFSRIGELTLHLRASKESTFSGFSFDIVKSFLSKEFVKLSLSKLYSFKNSLLKSTLFC